MKEKITTVPVPKALESLIIANNNRLKTYQAMLFSEVDEANAQMMQILKLDPAVGWKLDVDSMKYVLTQEETTEE